MAAFGSVLRAFRAVVLVVLSGTVLSVVGSEVLRRHDAASLQSEFERRSEERLLELEDQLNEDLFLLSFLRSFLLASEEVKPEEFQTFVAPPLLARRELESVEWLPRVVATERETFEEARRKEGRADFRITELTPEGETTPAGRREEYFPVRYVEPLAPNRAILGLDLASAPLNRQAMAKSRAGDVPVATGPLRKAGEDQGDPAFRVFLPVYRASSPAAAREERERSLIGFFAVSFRISELVEAALASLKSGEIDFLLYDETTPDRPFLYGHRSGSRSDSRASFGPDDAPRHPALTWRGIVEVPALRWSIECFAAPAFLAAEASWAWAWMLAGGLAFTALIAFNVYNVASRSREVERLVTERTRELSREVEEHRRTARELEKALRKSEESDRLKSAFLANISHEIRTPLNVITGFNQLIANRFDELGDRSQQELLDEVGRASQRLIDTVHATLDLSKMETGQFQAQPVRLDLPQVIEAHVRTIEPEARQKGIVLACEIRERRAAVRFDPYSFSQALTKLVDNAIKFTERGTIWIRLLRDASGELCFEVEDTGVGIHPDYLSRLFRPFSQEDPSFTRGFEGPGIGLALVRRHLELNAARITVESEKGKGSIFRVHFAKSSELP